MHRSRGVSNFSFCRKLTFEQYFPFHSQELRKRSQGMFRIDKISPSHWQSVARILKQGVGMSTLPCVKLRAIVDAAREISQLYEREHGKQALLDANQFLPIFIFCVVRAEMERPCALCKLCVLFSEILRGKRLPSF